MMRSGSPSPRRRRRRGRDPLDSVLVRLVPQALIEYPLEVMVSAWALLSGVTLLTGIADPASVAELLPFWLKIAWSASLALGGTSVAIGLLRRTYDTAVARGLSLIGSACGVYAIALLAFAGIARGVPAVPLIFIVGIICYLRGWWLRRRGMIMRSLHESIDR